MNSRNPMKRQKSATFTKKSLYISTLEAFIVKGGILKYKYLHCKKNV